MTDKLLNGLAVLFILAVVAAVLFVGVLVWSEFQPIQYDVIKVSDDCFVIERTHGILVSTEGHCRFDSK